MNKDLLTIILAIFGCSGFWALVQAIVAHFLSKKSNENKALIGLLHDRIYALCNQYIEQDFVTANQYKNLMALYEPYKALGGNSTAAFLKEQVDKLERKVDGE